MKTETRSTILIVALSLLLSAMAFSQSLNLDDAAPPLAGETLNGLKVALPGTNPGKLTFLAMAFSKGADGRTRAWTEPFSKEFGSDPKIAWYSVGMFEQIRAFVRSMTLMNMRRTVPVELQPHNLIVTSGENEWKQAVGADDSGLVYAILLDTKGKVAWIARGKPSQVSFEALRLKIREVEVTQTPDEPKG